MVAVGAVRCALVKKTTFQLLFGEAREVIQRNFNLKVLSGVPLIKDSGLSSSELEQVLMPLPCRCLCPSHVGAYAPPM